MKGKIKKVIPITTIMAIILLLLSLQGDSKSAIAADETLTPYIPQLRSIYRDTQVDSWVLRVEFGRPEPYYFWPTNTASMQAPTHFGSYVDDWTFSDLLGHWIYWWEDWKGNIHYYDLEQVIRRSTGDGVTRLAGRGESVVGNKVKLADGRVAYNCYYHVLPMDAEVTTGTINPWPGETLTQSICQFAYPQLPTPTPTATPVVTATPTPCCSPPQSSGCIAGEEHWWATWGTTWYPGRPFSGLIEVHVWWPNYTQERKLLLESWQRPGFINGGGSAWSWPVGCEQQARNAFNNNAQWISIVTLDQLHNEGRIQ